MLNNCVGEGNREFVIAYLCTSLNLVGTIAFSALFHLTKVIKPGEVNPGNRKSFDGAIVMIYLIAQATFLVFVYYLIYYVRKALKIRSYHKRKKAAALAAENARARSVLGADPGDSVDISVNLDARNDARKRRTTKKQRGYKVGPGNIDNLDSGSEDDSDGEIVRVGESGVSRSTDGYGT